MYRNNTDTTKFSWTFPLPHVIRYYDKTTIDAVHLRVNSLYYRESLVYMLFEVQDRPFLFDTYGRIPEKCDSEKVLWQTLPSRIKLMKGRYAKV